MEHLQKSFDAFIPITKAVENDKGEWFFHGPVASHKEDYDGDILEKAAVMQGLTMHDKLGGHVDYDHLYQKTHDLDHIIGKRVAVYEDPEMGPCMVTKLFKNKPLAQKAWRHHEAGGVLGYSIVGKAVRNPRDSKRVINTEIHMVTIAPSPKGFDARLKSGMPAPDLMSIAKALGSDEGWEPIEIEGIEEIVEIKAVEEIAEKSMTTGSGIVASGEQGGSALRVQELKGSTADTRGFTRKKWADRKKKFRAAAMAKAVGLSTENNIIDRKDITGSGGVSMKKSIVGEKCDSSGTQVDSYSHPDMEWMDDWFHCPGCGKRLPTFTGAKKGTRDHPYVQIPDHVIEPPKSSIKSDLVRKGLTDKGAEVVLGILNRR